MSSKPSMLTVAGLPTARGYVSGPVFLYTGEGTLVIPEYAVPLGEEAAELARLERARAAVRRDLENLIAVLRERTGRADVMVFECHLMILDDPMLVAESSRAISVQHLNAAAAVRQAAAGAREKFERMNDPYFRERVRDLLDVERRLLKSILGLAENPALDLAAPAIVVADDLTPSETIRLPRGRLLGFATNGGSATSHVALLARALGIPAVTGLGDITQRVTPGATILLDGTNGAVTIHPDESTVTDFNRLIARQTKLLDSIASAGVPAGTLKDGGTVRIYANLHPGVPFAGVRELGARGVGLYRSEYLWLARELEPTEEEQFAAYRDVAKFTTTLSPDATVTIRMLDIGGDKTVRGISAKEANPFMGNRSIRYLLSERSVLRTQLRAVLRASAFGRICLMYPMVSCVEELEEAARELAAAKRELDARGVDYDRNIPVGAMIEVPSAALNAAAFARYVDFFSIGTNDLVQYTMAADRTNESVAHLYQPTNPAVLQLVRQTIAAAKARGLYVSVCGESATDPTIGVLWVAMGIDMLSMSATYIPTLSAVLRRLTRADLDELREKAESIDPAMPAAEIYAAGTRWLRGKIPDLDELLV